MKTSDTYHKWVERSEDDQAYLGKCPERMTGIHGDDALEVGYTAICSPSSKTSLRISRPKADRYLHRACVQCVRLPEVSPDSLHQGPASPYREL